MDTLAWGSLIAVLLRNSHNLIGTLKRFALWLAPMSVAGIAGLWMIFGAYYYSRNPLTSSLGFSFNALFYATMLI